MLNPCDNVALISPLLLLIGVIVGMVLGGLWRGSRIPELMPGHTHVMKIRSKEEVGGKRRHILGCDGCSYRMVQEVGDV